MFVRKLLVAALLSSAGVAHAGDKPLYQPLPGWVVPAPALDVTRLGDGDPMLQILDFQQRLEPGGMSIYTETAMRIATPQMLTEAGTLPLQWDPSHGDLIVHKVMILRGAEQIDLLARGARFTVLQRERKLEQAALDGLLTATLALEGLRVGDVVRFSYSVTRKDAVLGQQTATAAPLLFAPLKVGFGRVRLLWPSALPVQWRSYAAGPVAAAQPGAAAPAEPRTLPNGDRELVITFPVAKPPELPADAPQRYKPLALVEASSFGDWSRVAGAMAPYYRTEGTIPPDSPLGAEVARIAAASSDPRTRAAMALRLVQDQVRYLFRGMDSGNYVPQSPTQTWSLRYGDCKAKSILLVAMLRALQIDAEPALVSMEGGDLVASRLPSPLAFDHVIVRAVIGGKTLWLDGTQSGTRLEDLDDVPAFRTALPVRAEGATLIPIPVATLPVRPTQSVQVTLDSRAGPEYPAPFDFRADFYGQMAQTLRSIRSEIDKDKLADLVNGQITPVLGVHSAYGYRISYDDASGGVTLSASGIAYPDWDFERGRQRINLDQTAGNLEFTPNRARSAWRDIPVAAGALSDVRIVRRIRLPAGGKGYTLEGQQKLPAEIAGRLMSRNVTIAGDSVTVDDRVFVGAGEVPAGQIATVRAEVARIKANPLTLVGAAEPARRWMTVKAARAGGALAPIIAGYDKAIAEQPEQADGYISRAWFYQTIYDRQAALRDVGKAIELAPTVDLYAQRAELHYTLRDEAAALADIKAALDLDPEAKSPILLLARIKAEKGEVDAARDLLLERVDRGGDAKAAWQFALAGVLGDAGDVDGALAILDEAIAAAPRNSGLYNSRCWVRGTHDRELDQALRDCNRAIELSENSGASLDSRAMVHFRMRRFDEARADLDAALLANTEQADSLFMRGVIGRLQKAPGADADLAAARLISPRIDEQFARYGIRP